MILNPGLTVLDGTMIGLSSLAGLVLSLYWGLRAWRSNPAAWIEFNRTLRPSSWRRWPIYAALWHHMDSHGSWYLWQARVGSVLGVLFCGLGLVIGAMVILQAR